MPIFWRSELTRFGLNDGAEVARARSSHTTTPPRMLRCAKSYAEGVEAATIGIPPDWGIRGHEVWLEDAD